ncbi:MAG: carbohydrate ABC transporter permease [Sphaerochaetaceae bacterium]|nr:carbohydrate ABC transporter permease [Sphaerochaetaceae bacterium]MDD3163605.1 carbohydrate ABC transporter permease [Sphaerochaetaceae bacterium]MDD4007655.1 carbohydrate ABC transporter permease [Sphaerochaetaceae bacterium]MDD4396879.1 carbohydrate ABC transporter permease [Sphaerochaetaceae bacterium]
MKTDFRQERSLGAYIWKIIGYIIMILFSLLAIVPVLWLIVNSFKTTVEFNSNMAGWPKKFFTQNYPGAWRAGDFGILFVNSVVYTVMSVGISGFFSLLAGFGFSKIPGKSAKIIYSIFILGLLLTTQTLMVPIFLQVSQLDGVIGRLLEKVGLCAAEDFHLFYNTRFAVILVYVGSLLPIGIYLCTEYVRSIPTSLVEAARIDGAGYLRIFNLIVIPMSTPILITLGLLNIPTIWNEFALINILVSKTSLQSLPLGIYRFSGTLSSDYGKEFAALVIGLMPMLLFYLIFRKQITNNVGAGAVKG